MKTRICLAAALCVAWIASPAPSSAQSEPVTPAPRAMKAVDLIEIPRIGDSQLSRDGRQILFTRSEADWKLNRRVSHIDRIDADGGGLRQMTTGPEGESSPRWAPDGRRFAFIARRAGAEGAQIHLMANEGGEARRLTSHPTGVSQIQWAPDGSAVFFLASDPKTAEEKASEEAKDDVYALDENYKQTHLWRVDVESGKSSRVTSGDFSITAFNISRDGKRIAAQRGPTPLFGDSENGEVYVMDIDGANAVRITTNGVDEFFPTISPKGDLVLFTTGANERFEPYYSNRAFVAPVGGGPARVLAPAFPHAIDRAQWLKDGQEVLFSVNLGVRRELFVLDVATGRTRQVTDGSHALLAGGLVPEVGRIALVVDEPMNPGEIWIASLDAPSTFRQVSHLSEGYARDFKLGRQERIEWKGADGLTVEGLLHYPVDHVPGKRYPLVVQTHGGPRSSDMFGFGEWQSYAKVLTGLGYAVLQPNYRGSTGYGDAFLRDMVGSYFKNSHLDVMTGVDKVIAMGIADPERLAKMGWSAGGHMTNKVITFTDRFKAASSGAGASNWISMFGQSDTRAYRIPWFGGTPWGKNAPMAAYWDHSPIKDVANVKTPTLFIVGERDVRVPPPQSLEMHRALKSNGVPTRMYVAPREPHTFEELRHQLFKINVEIEWFEKYVMGRTYTKEVAPKGN
jgi:dipeptidyl aminopeptidase/acylaminoacyl peptidase